MSPEMLRVIGYTLLVPAAGAYVFHHILEHRTKQYVRNTYPELKGFGGRPLYKETQKLAKADTHLKHMLKRDQLLGILSYAGIAGAAAMAGLNHWFFPI